ncbi:hypothetical protein EMCRGX_G014962, partial [Ephydatia muelleri]
LTPLSNTHDSENRPQQVVMPQSNIQESSPLHTLKSVDKEDSTIQLGNISMDDTCKYKKRCATKSCPCRRKNQPCSSWCHAERSCCNTFAMERTAHLSMSS